MTNKLSLTSVAAVATWMAAISPASAADLTVRISFDQQFDRTLPEEKVTLVHHEVAALIGQNGQVRTTSEKTLAGRHHTHVSDFESEKALGPEDHSHWRVVDQNKLVYIADFLTFQRAIELTVRNGACTAQVDYELKPGFTDYRYKRKKKGDVVTARSVAASELTCSVTQTADRRPAK